MNEITPETIEEKAPEVPNLISLLYHYFSDSTFLKLLHQWESVIFSIFMALLISLFFTLGTKKKELIPSGLQNFLEWAVDLLRNLVINIIGPKGEKYIPFLGTLFIYIWTMNLMGLVPFMKSPTSNLNITAALAICVFVLVQYLNIKHMGLGGFLYHLAGSPTNALGWIMAPLMFPIELLTQASRPITLALRLFGNVLGEDILIGTFALFGFAWLSTYNSPVGAPLQLPFMLLGLLTSFMQALVFTLLSAIYILLSMPHEEHESNFKEG